MATVNGAIAQGRSDETGRLKAGYDADLIMINTDAAHLRPVYDPISTVVYSARGSDVELTMVRGRTLYRDGKWLTLDIGKTVKAVEEYAVPIVKNE
ncbi:MAG: amidohydrolase family protein, partial [Clostridia bacterium]|nr:amidohydrolase family protein [Clostridia bacterium]